MHPSVNKREKHIFHHVIWNFKINNIVYKPNETMVTLFAFIYKSKLYAVSKVR